MVSKSFLYDFFPGLNCPVFSKPGFVVSVTGVGGFVEYLPCFLTTEPPPRIELFAVYVKY